MRCDPPGLDPVETHARRRARERYRLDLTHRAYLSLCRRAGKAQPRDRRNDLLWGERDGRAGVALQAEGRWLLAIYDRQVRRIVTFLPARDLPDIPKFRGRREAA